MEKQYDRSQKFIGNTAPFLLFEMEYHSLSYVVETHKNDRFYSAINPSAQIAFIGLLSYFEAFCKHQFAAIINVLPSILSSFCFKRDEPNIEISEILNFKDTIENNLGFLLAEKYDFGTVKSINGLFRDLLSISPFSNSEADIFNSILYKRNLIVHHGGYYTLYYIKKNSHNLKTEPKPFKDSIKIDTEDYHEIADFLFQMALKITKTTIKALRNTNLYKQSSRRSEIDKILNELLQGLYDTLDD